MTKNGHSHQRRGNWTMTPSLFPQVNCEPSDNLACRLLFFWLDTPRRSQSAEKWKTLIIASYPALCCTREPGGKGAGIAFYPKAWRSWKTGIVLGHIYGVWLSGALTAMALEQVGDSAGPADTGILTLTLTHLLSYPLAFLSRYLKRVVSSLVYLPTITFFL